MDAIYTTLILANISIRLLSLSGLEGFREEYSIRRADYWKEKASSTSRGSYKNIRFYEEALSTRPDDVQAALALGEIYYDLAITYGRRDLFRRSRDYFETASRIDPYLVLPHYRLGTIHFLMGNFDFCRHELEEARRLDPEFQPVADSLRMLRERLRADEPASAKR